MQHYSCSQRLSCQLARVTGSAKHDSSSWWHSSQVQLRRQNQCHRRCHHHHRRHQFIIYLLSWSQSPGNRGMKFWCVFYANVLKYILTSASARRKPAVRGVQLKQRATLSPHTLLSMSWQGLLSCNSHVTLRFTVTSVFDRRTFPVLRSTCSWWVTTYVGKPSAVRQPTRPTQPFILSG